MVFACGTDSFANLRIGIESVAGLLRGRARDYSESKYVPFNDGRCSIVAVVEHVFAAELLESAEGRALLRVVIEHLLLGHSSHRFDSGRLVCRTERGFPAGDAHRDQDSDNSDYDHQLDQGKALIAASLFSIVSHKKSPALRYT